MMVFGMIHWSGSVFSTRYTTAFLSNGLFAVSMSYYFYLTFRGYAILPFITKP